MLIEKTVLRRVEFVFHEGEINPAAHAQYERQMIESDTGEVRGVLASHRETFDITGPEAEKVNAIMGEALASAVAVHEAHAKMHAETVEKHQATVKQMEADHQDAMEKMSAQHKDQMEQMQAHFTGLLENMQKQFDEYRRQASGIIAAQAQELDYRRQLSAAIVAELQKGFQPQPAQPPAEEPPAA